tara:strand:+ start:907 stop:1611 length:705 start_codon:yes stop_codon:yes gene_type:complete
MKVDLKERPKHPIIIEGFPGFGFVGTIATEFLIKHLNAKPIGKIWSKSVTPIVAIHAGEPVDPLGIYYDKKHNIVIFHAISNLNGMEWELSDTLYDLARELDAKEIISLEAVNAPKSQSRVFYYSNNEEKIKQYEKIKLEPINDGIVAGVSGSLILKVHRIPFSCLFVESSTGFPDSLGAAKLIETLDKHLGLKVNPKPLEKAAKKFEEKLKSMMSQAKQSTEAKDQKQLDYMG